MFGNPIWSQTFPKWPTLSSTVRKLIVYLKIRETQQKDLLQDSILSLLWSFPSHLFITKCSKFTSYKITGKSIKNATLNYENCMGPEFRWYLNLWFFNDFWFGQNLPHRGQLYPLVSTCLASTCSYSLVLFLTLQPHVLHLQTPSTFSIWDSTAVFSSDRINVNFTYFRQIYFLTDNWKNLCNEITKWSCQSHFLWYLDSCILRPFRLEQCLWQSGQ